MSECSTSCSRTVRLTSGAVYDWAGPTAGMLQFYTSMIGSQSSEIISVYESKRDSFQAAIDATIDTFTK